MNEEMYKSKFAIAIFAYNRPKHLERCLQSLTGNAELSGLRPFIFIDGPKPNDSMKISQEVVMVAEEFKSRFPMTEIIYSKRNLGLRNSVISGLSQLFNLYEALIILEDDLIVSPLFLAYMLRNLSQFQMDRRISSVSAFAESRFHPLIKTNLVASRRQSCWGWGTWRDRWNSVNWNIEYRSVKDLRRDLRLLGSIGWDLEKIYLSQVNRKISSWAIYFDLYAAKNNLRAIQPRYSLTQNLGFDGSGTHFNVDTGVKQSGSVWELKNTRSENTYSISTFFDFWLRCKHSWLHNEYQKVFFAVKNRLPGI